MNQSRSIFKAYSDELFRKINVNDELPKSIKENPAWGMRFVISNLAIAKEIDDIAREIESILNRLGKSHKTILTTYSIEELVLGVKYYLLAWSAMKDLMANFINISFDLGIHEKDINYGMMLRNEKIKNTDIPKIIKEHALRIDISNTDKQRNEVAHRGRLLDKDIVDFKSRYNRIYAERYSLLELSPISDAEYKEKIKVLDSELLPLVKQKREEYKTHFYNTMELNKSLAIVLAKVSVDYLNNIKNI